jgi:hypothetical protein
MTALTAALVTPASRVALLECAIAECERRELDLVRALTTCRRRDRSRLRRELVRVCLLRAVCRYDLEPRP